MGFFVFIANSNKITRTSTLLIFNENKTKKLHQFHTLFKEKKYL
ncbi:hypothetical protein RC62_1813 [Flavobacterium aquidurense]|uniref:Uncharacterized protein n=1 Tax=Flavobacterium aquidurense TaxID=362413 RepID=A0A0Q1BDD5_9FLAO|nr:hypothetical protein RC62_1813 [Flavobacterium aquidurense]